MVEYQWIGQYSVAMMLKDVAINTEALVVAPNINVHYFEVNGVHLS